MFICTQVLPERLTLAPDGLRTRKPNEGWVQHLVDDWNPAFVTSAILYVDVTTLAPEGRLRDLFTSACRKAGLSPKIVSRECWRVFKDVLLEDLQNHPDGGDQLTIYIIAGNHTNLAHIRLKQNRDPRVTPTRPADL